MRAVRPAVRPASTRFALAVLLLVASTLSGALVASSPTAAATEGRTWVVDAVDSTSSNTWESVDTGTSVVTIAVGDTVEWQFDRANQGHDLTSLAPSSAWETVWPTPLVEHREANGTPVTYTFDQPGTYRYECSIHGSMMTGTIVVVAPGSNAEPTIDPVVEPTSGPAPLVVHATANAADPDGDVVATSWDFGTGAAATYTDHAMFEYTTPGTYVVRLRVSDGRGGLREQDFPVTVTQGSGPVDPEPPADDGLPAIDALAAPAQGTAPLAVAFSTQVTTTGTLHAYSVGLDAYPDLTGTAVLVRSRGRTHTSLQVSGTKPSAVHSAVHVHEQACADNLGGAHFRFDTAQPFAEPNEIWPLFTSDATGASGLVEVTKPVRAGPKAVSVVVHDPDNAARRIGCADLTPGTADLTYSWSFGDGTTGSGADPDHTYATPGAYTATVTVAHGTGEHAGHLSVSDTVQVVVGGGATPPAPAPAVDTTPPRISKVGPVRSVRTARPTVRARVADPGSGVRTKAIVLRVDGRRVTGIRYDARRGLVRWKPRPALAPGRHVVRLRVTDAAGNRQTRTWHFKVVKK
ncbi:PKD repeat protein [Nocardioides sp. BE266]|uniref:PKD domain-containing protein n=1 Tax=Nocardioides sp. BE266 TaxID=2817725 RepID=UPI0028618610|nr:PKD domain-containing protein [Nocardioides sp. BE266]MDR7252210.1 PKD repeat protein [Nocardioides sp. BE266]